MTVIECKLGNAEIWLETTDFKKFYVWLQVLSSIHGDGGETAKQEVTSQDELAEAVKELVSHIQILGVDIYDEYKVKEA